MRATSIFKRRLPSAFSGSVICATLVCLAVMVPSVPVLAQNTGMQELLNRVERLQRELSTLITVRSIAIITGAITSAI